MPGLRGFFVAWEADALPTELFPLNDLRLRGLLRLSKWVPIRDPFIGFENSTRPIGREVAPAVRRRRRCNHIHDRAIRIQFSPPNAPTQFSTT
jgi:hypothetical protein